MPIVNGTYVYDQMPVVGKKSYQEQTGDKWTSRDWSDTSSAQYNFLLKQQENAFNVEMWNEMNKYNSPQAQMQRFQDAGLNPNLIYSQQNTTSPLQAAANSAFRSQGTHAKKIQNQLSTIQTMQGLVESAAKTYDYVNYGAETNRWKMIQAQEQALGLKMDNAWNDWLLHGDNMIYGDASRLPYGPRAQQFQNQMGLTANQRDLTHWNIQRVKFMVNSLLPTQEARQKALTALDQYQYDMMQGKYGAILDVHTGLGETVDNWVRLIMFMALAKMM